jgi:hypothetical protein
MKAPAPKTPDGIIAVASLENTLSAPFKLTAVTT